MQRICGIYFDSTLHLAYCRFQPGMRRDNAQQRAHRRIVVAGAAAQLPNRLFSLVAAPPAPERLGAEEEEFRQVRCQSVGTTGSVSGALGESPILLVIIEKLAVTNGELCPGPRK